MKTQQLYARYVAAKGKAPSAFNRLRALTYNLNATLETIEQAAAKEDVEALRMTILRGGAVIASFRPTVISFNLIILSLMIAADSYYFSYYRDQRDEVEAETPSDVELLRTSGIRGQQEIKPFNCTDLLTSVRQRMFSLGTRLSMMPELNPSDRDGINNIIKMMVDTRSYDPNDYPEEVSEF